MTSPVERRGGETEPVRCSAALCGGRLCQGRPGVASGDHAPSTMIEAASLLDPDLADIDGHHQRIERWPVIGSAYVGPALRRQLYSVGLDIGEHELRGGETAGDIDVVVVPPQEQILAEEEILNGTVAGDRAREERAQYAPGLDTFAPRSISAVCTPFTASRNGVVR
jgi:hypothetical protein